MEGTNCNGRKQMGKIKGFLQVSIKKNNNPYFLSVFYSLHATVILTTVTIQTFEKAKKKKNEFTQ